MSWLILSMLPCTPGMRFKVPMIAVWSSARVALACCVPRRRTSRSSTPEEIKLTREIKYLYVADSRRRKELRINNRRCGFGAARQNMLLGFTRRNAHDFATYV